MALELFIVETQSGRVLAEVPGTPGGPLSREAGGFTSASFSIHLSDPAMPANWEALLAEQKHSVLAVDEQGSTRTPVWLGIINERSVKDGGAKVQCVSTEWLLDARRAADRTWGATTDLMKIVRDLVTDFEANGLGAGLVTDAPDIGTKRAWSVKRSEGKSPAKCLEELGIEWSVELSWASPDQAAVLKTLRARKFDVGVMPAPKRVIQVPAHTSSWEWTASRLESESATIVFVEGDGSGDLRTVSLPVVDAAREAAGYPRVEAWESVSGVTNAAEAGQLAAQFATRKFARHERIELSARNSTDGSPLAGLSIGDAIRVSIDTDSLQREATYRLASWDLDPSGSTWTPVLVPAEFGLEGWRRPGAKSAALAARQEAKKQQATSQDPLKNGYQWGDSKLDPEKGFQVKGSDGEWGGVGGGGLGSTNILGTVDSVIYAPDGKVNIISGAETIQAMRSSFYQPAAGDEVAVGTFGGQPVLLTPVTQDQGEGGGGTTDPGEPTPHPGVIKLQLESGWVNTDINQYGLATATLDKNQWVIWTGSIVANVAMPAGSIVARLPASHTTPVEGWMSYFRFLQNGDVVTTVSIAANTVIHLSSIVYQTRSSGLTNSSGIAWGVDGDSTAFFMGLSASRINGIPNPRYAYVPVSKSEGDASRPFYTTTRNRSYTYIEFSGPWSSPGSGMPARYSTDANTRNWTHLTLENGWNHAGEGGANGYEGGGGPFQLAKNNEGVVTFSGVTHKGVLSARICVLPKGFRPKFTTVFPSSGGTSGVRVEPDGSVFRADSSSGTVSANHAMWHADH